MSVTPESVQILINSSDFGERIKGINQLRSLDPKIAFEIIQPLVTDPNARVRYAAVSQLDPLGKQDLDKALELLLDRLRYDSEVDVKAVAADVIGGLKLTTAFEDLQQLYYQTSEWLIQLSIIACLGEFGDPRGFELLESALNSDNNLVKTAAISSLGELGDQKAIAVLMPFLEDEDWQIRYRLVQAFGRLGGEQTRAALEQLSQDSVEQVAQEAKTYLNH
ncbi:PBS lyase HEAT domain protein repeat-containing protein [Gloeothece citriformis PCC 7424]|uniref:PBS lyase HEAT domain protein repeat-containing protein n=1 Tax=Gloeothece citriformis (strain PCC 7424) TaxID=65393 RepID=B7KK94_GLOC7|nr:HEAT repeat domain-containing protein [Gloeothece citriformis]ACK70979.1 PBS lyase HEAT domain protein repeat-containing protein [Gloeothece citriformis PCC 7424]